MAGAGRAGRARAPRRDSRRAARALRCQRGARGEHAAARRIRRRRARADQSRRHRRGRPPVPAHLARGREMREFLDLLLILGGALTVGSALAAVLTVLWGLRPVYQTGRTMRTLTYRNLARAGLQDVKAVPELKPFVEALDEMIGAWPRLSADRNGSPPTRPTRSARRWLSPRAPFKRLKRPGSPNTTTAAISGTPWRT